THFPDEGFFHAVHFHLRRLPVMNRADARFRNEYSHFDVLRWQQDDDRFAGSYPFTLPKKRVVDQTRLRRRLFFLIETPICLIQSLLVLISRGTGPIQILRRGHSGPEKFFLSRELGFRKNERRFDLLARSFLSGLIQREQRLTGCHLLTSLHGKYFQLASKRRCNVNEFPFDITLELILRLIAATGQTGQERDSRRFPQELIHRAHAFRPFVVSAPSRTILRIPAKPSFGIMPSSSIFGGFMIDCTIASNISMISLAGTSLRTIPARCPSTKSFPKWRWSSAARRRSTTLKTSGACWRLSRTNGGLISFNSRCVPANNSRKVVGKSCGRARVICFNIASTPANLSASTASSRSNLPGKCA